VTQPAISQQLRALEADHGVTLVVRAGRGVRLTAAGELLASRATPILAALASAEDELDAMCRGEAGLVRILTARTALERLAAPAVTRARKQNDGLRCKLEELGFVGHGHAFEALTRGEIDMIIAVTGMDGLGWADVEARPLTTTALTAVVPTAHELAGATEVRPADLVGVNTVLVADTLPILDSTAFAELRTNPDSSTIVSDVPAALSLTRHDQGIAVVPFRPEVLPDDVVAVDLAPSVEVSYVVALHQHFEPSVATEALLGALNDQVADNDT
jgi:DNA-binding transcriptional LysR family regulator